MLFGRVLGTAVCTLKYPGTEGLKLLIVQPLDKKLEPVGPLQVASAGDAVQFLITGHAMGYIAVVGRAPGGLIHVYVPREGTEADRYDPKTPLLPGVAQLQPGVGREEVVGLFSPEPFDLAPVLEALRAGKPLDGLLPEGSVTAVVPLKKEAEQPAAQ